MRILKLAAVVLPLLLGIAGLPPASAAAEQSAAPRIAADQIALLLGRLRAPARLPLTPIDSSCATTCGSGPEGSCTKSCPSSQSCEATCSGGKAICRCQ